MAKRKANHHGSVVYIDSRKDTKPWRVRLVRDGREYSKYFATEDEAENYRNKLVARDVPLQKRDTTKSFQTFCEETWLPVKKQTLKPRSYQTLAMNAKNHVYRHLGLMAIGQIGNKDVQDMVFALAKQGLSKSMVNKCKNSATSCLRYAASNSFIERYPIVEIIMPSEECYPTLVEKEMEWYSEEEMEKYVAECYRTFSNGKPKHPNGPMYALIMHTGIRQGEGFALEWSDYDENAYKLRISKNAVCVKNDNGEWKMLVQHSPKSKAGGRTISLNKQAVMDLEALKKLNGDKRYILSNSNCGIMNPSPFLQGHHRICVAAGIKTTGVHSLRHTYVTYKYYRGLEALKQGKHFDPRDLAQEVGHANLRTMYEIYTHLSLRADANASRRFEDLDEF